MDLSEPLRTALLDDATITAQLPAYAGSKTVFTRRPVPDNAEYPMIIVSADVGIVDEDGIDDQRPVITRDVAVFGRNDVAESYRQVEDIGFLVRDLFHRRRDSIVVPGWNVIDVRAAGPFSVSGGRVEESVHSQTNGRIVTLTVRLAKMN